MAYQLEGSLLEVCTCNILCPCWVGEDPDGGTCDGVLAWHFDRGSINGTDVAGRTFVILTHIPGSPAYVGKADSYEVNAPEHGFELALQGHNAVQGSFRFEA